MHTNESMENTPIDKDSTVTFKRKRGKIHKDGIRGKIQRGALKLYHDGVIGGS